MSLTRRATMLAAGLFAVFALAATACGSSSNNNSTTGTTGGSGFDYSSLSGTLNGSGSTFQKDFNEAAIQGFSDVAQNVTVNYAGGGSGKGKTDLANEVVQWAGTDSTIKSDQLSTFKGGTVLYFPTVAAPITVSFNLSGVSKIQLSASTLGGIFSGKITKWNDSAIAADNPGVSLPSTAITVVHRSDGSGTTNQFTHYLTLAAGSSWALGTGDTVNWPTSTKAANGNPGVAQAVKATDGAIGYVDYSTAVASKLTFASIKNKSGSYVAPSLDAASAALETAQVNANLTYLALDASGADAYPITAATYVIVYQNQSDATIGKALQGWLHYLLTDGQALANPNNYAKLPASLDQKALAQIDTMKIG
ncbi:MAG TPA: phosphate ABC transporter substrate-binding protein PstS [Acidimicrobiales bacterium]|nr:phosphate ABC transporter substrate-binding protein PstS [Acidimicrobiales bacterium]